MRDDNSSYKNIKDGKRNLDGIINVYKEAGFTSHDVVAKLRASTMITELSNPRIENWVNAP